MLSFVAENSTIISKIYSRSPRHLVLAKLVASSLARLLLKYPTLRFINLLPADNLWCAYRLVNYKNKSTASINLSITSYYTYVQAYFKNNFSCTLPLSSAKHLFRQANINGLPLSRRTSNTLLMLTLLYGFSNYLPLCHKFLTSREYFYSFHFLLKYTNLNFYYLRLYSH
jgi:hypothetical protein